MSVNKKRLFIVSLILFSTLFTASLWADDLDSIYIGDLKKIYSRFSEMWRVTKKQGSGHGLLGKIKFYAYNVADEDISNVMKKKYKLLWIYVRPEEDNFAMNVRLDKWILVDKNGKKHKAINCINYYDQNFYFYLPGKAKELFMFYPSYAMGERYTSFFVFFEASVNTKGFQKIIYRNAHLKRDIYIKNAVK